MIKFKYSDPSDAKGNSVHETNGGVYIEVQHTPLGVDFPYDLPLSFQVINTELRNVVWQTDLYPGNWASYPWGFGHSVVVKDIKDNIVFEWIWNPLLHGDNSHKFFTSWAIANKGSKGIAIGTHDGSDGEWVYPTRKGYLQSFLVEASEKQYLRLAENFKDISNAETINSLVTPNGGDVEFFQGGDGLTDSVIKKHTQSYIGDNITSTNINSISLNDLIINLGLANDLKWLHLDVEGIDVDLILSIDENRIKLPEVIIYESLNLEEEEIQKVNNWFIEKGYIFEVSGWNTFAFKK